MVLGLVVSFAQVVMMFFWKTVTKTVQNLILVWKGEVDLVL